MKQERTSGGWNRKTRELRPDFATLVAAAVARQASSPTARVIAAADAGPIRPVSLIELFGEQRRRRGQVSAASFNTGVAALLSRDGET
jgi:hypothetical protein